MVLFMMARGEIDFPSSNGYRFIYIALRQLLNMQMMEAGDGDVEKCIRNVLIYDAECESNSRSAQFRCVILCFAAPCLVHHSGKLISAKAFDWDIPIFYWPKKNI